MSEVPEEVSHDFPLDEQLPPIEYDPVFCDPDEEIIEGRLGAVRRPIAGWYPAAVRVVAGQFGGQYEGGPYRGVVHTTESKNYNPTPVSYYGHQNWPHFTIAIMRGGEVATYQHIGIGVASRALRNKPGGVETNRRSAIQIELAWTSADILNLPEVMQAELRRLMIWIEQSAGVKAKALPNGAIPNSARENAPQRLSFRDWNVYDGWCGHRHVPENHHWDAGAIDWEPLLIREAPPTPRPPVPPQEDEMSWTPNDVIDVTDTGETWIVNYCTLTRRKVPKGREQHFRNLAGSAANKQFAGPYTWDSSRLADFPPDDHSK